MANTISSALVQAIYDDLMVVAQEPTGFIGAVSRIPSNKGLYKGATITIPDVPSQEAEDLTPSNTKPYGGDETIGSSDLVITKARRTKFTWNGDEQMSIGSLLNPVLRKQRQQAFRTIRNEMEADIASALVGEVILKGGITGTAGTTPFASNLNELTKAQKILTDKGAPMSDLQLVLNTTASMNLRNLQQLQKVSEAGEDGLLRDGVLGRLFSFDIRESSKLVPFGTTSVTTGYLCNGGASAGATSVTVDTGSGKILAGSVVTFGSATTQYIVKEDVASGGTTIKLTTALLADVADNATVNLVSNTPNVAFSRSCAYLATAIPAVPEGGDDAKARTYVTDPISGITYEIAVWGGAYQNTVTVSALWGVKTFQPENAVVILG